MNSNENILISLGFGFVQYSAKKDYKKYVRFSNNAVTRVNVYPNGKCFIVLKRKTEPLDNVYDLNEGYEIVSKQRVSFLNSIVKKFFNIIFKID